MKNEISRKRSRETAYPDNPHSRQSADTTKLQRLRQDHRFTPNEKAIMTPRMEMKEYKQQQKAHFQAQEELKMLAERKGFTSGKIALGKRVPRRYQKALGGGHKEAEAYLEKNVKSFDRQLVRDVAQGIKEETRIPIRKAAQTYKELLGNEANPSQRSSQCDAEPEYDQGSSSSSRAASSSQSDSGSEDDDAGSSSSHNEGHSSDQHYESDSDEGTSSSTKLPKNDYFSERYAYKSELKAADGNLSYGCGVDATMTVLQAMGYNNLDENKVAKQLGYKQGTGFPLKNIPSVLEKYSIHYQCLPLRIDELQERVQHGPIISWINKGLPESHAVVIEKIEGDWVFLLDCKPYKVPIHEWKDVWIPISNVVPEW